MPQAISLQNLRANLGKDISEFIDQTKTWDTYLQFEFDQGEKQYTVLPVGKMLESALKAGYTLVQNYHAIPTSGNKDFPGRRAYFLIHAEYNKAVFIEDWLDCKHAARIYFSYLHEDNFKLESHRYAPILWHQEAVLNHQFNTTSYMLEIFSKIIAHHEVLHKQYVERADQLKKIFSLTGKARDISDLLTRVCQLRCKAIEKIVAYVLKLSQNPNFQSFDWVAKQYAIRHTMISGKVFGKTEKGDWKFDKPLWGEYSDMDRKLEEVYQSFIS